VSAPSIPGDPQHALLDAIFSHAPVGLGFWDAELRYRRINDALAEINGVPVDDHIGHTPGELLGALGTEAEAPLRQVLATGESVTGVSHSGVMPAKPGEHRHWLASYYPVLDPDGDTVGVAAAVVEVTQQHEAEAERLKLLKDAVTARAHAEAAQIRAESAQGRAEAAHARTEFLAEAGRRMAISMDYEATLQEVAEIAVPVIADYCVVTVARTGGRLERLAVAHFDSEITRIARETMMEHPSRRSDPTGPGAVIRTGEPELVEEIDAAFLERTALSPQQRAAMLASGLSATLIVPLKTPDGTIGAISFAMAESGRAFTEEDVSLALGLAGRAALHIRNAQLYTERSHIAQTLQAGLLPRSLPEIPGVEVAARHRAAGTANEVGGDFYDVFPSEEGVWTALIGDVTGKGPEAAAVTSLAPPPWPATRCAPRP
jgi:PAS domain S-box-containing protein